MLAKKIQFSELPEHRTPVLNYCRILVKEGVHPSTKLEVYRNNAEPDLTVSSISYGATLTVDENGNRNPGVFYAPYRPR